jgi:hypothetical protein
MSKRRIDPRSIESLVWKICTSDSRKVFSSVSTTDDDGNGARSMESRRLLIAAAVLGLSLGASGCGKDESHDDTTGTTESTTTDTTTGTDTTGSTGYGDTTGTGTTGTDTTSMPPADTTTPPADTTGMPPADTTTPPATTPETTTEPTPPQQDQSTTGGTSN